MEPINKLTAEPLLRLLVARAGHDPVEGIPFSDAWTVFRTFLAIPSVYADDAATFQILVDVSPELEPAAAAILSRELRWKPEDGFDTGVRRALLHFPPGAAGNDLPEEVVMWSSDYESTEAFVAAVERTPAFRVLSDDALFLGTVNQEWERDSHGPQS